MVGRAVRVMVWGGGFLLSACGGQSSDVRPPNEGGASSTGGHDSGPNSSGGVVDSAPSSSGGLVDSPPVTTSHGGTPSIGAGGTEDAPSTTEPANTAGSTSGGADNSATGGASSGGDAACTGEACRLAVSPTPLWVTRLKGSGRGPATIRFSETDELVHIGAGQDYFSTTLDRNTGQVVGVPKQDRTVLATDTSGRWTVRQTDQDCAVFDDESPAFSFQCSWLHTPRFSADGSALADQSCLSEQDELIQLDVYDTASGARMATTTANLPCLYGDDDWNALVDSEHRRTLFAHPYKNDLYIFDWASQSVTSRSIHEPSPRSLQPTNREGTILNLSLSHGGQLLVSVGAADGLAWHARDTLDVELRVPTVPFFNLYDKCYCTYLAESPIAWSPADEIYATAHSSGGIELRSVATQQTLAVLDPPSAPEVINGALSSGFGPALLQFAPDLRHLVALYPHYAAGYSLAR